MPKIDIALDPLRAPQSRPRDRPMRSAVIAMAEHGGFLNAPDVYMDKIAVGGGLPEGIVDLDKTPQQNLSDLAKARRSMSLTSWSASSIGPVTPS